MKLKTHLLGAMLLMFVFSCKKENTLLPEKVPADLQSSADASILACYYGMQGVFSTDSPYWQADTVAIDPYVSGGVFQMHTSPYWSPYWTTMQLWKNSDFCELGIADADTLNFTIRLKNPSSESGAVPSYDVSIHMFGENKTATASFIGDSWHQQYTHLKVGTEGEFNLPEMVHTFEDWTEVTMRTTGTTCAVYFDGVLVKSINYSGAIGRLKDVRVTFKGYGSIDYFRVTGLLGAKIVRNEFTNVSSPFQGLEFYW